MTVEELSTIVKAVGTAGAALWGGTCAIVGALWKRQKQLETQVSFLQEEAADGNAVKDMVAKCSIHECPIRVIACSGCGVAFFFLLVGCAQKKPEDFDKKIKIVVEHKDIGSPVSGIIQSIAKLIPL